MTPKYTASATGSENLQHGSLPLHIRINPDRWVLQGNVSIARPTEIDIASKLNLNHVVVRPSSESPFGNRLEEPERFLSRRERRRLKRPRAESSAGRLWLLHRWQGQVLKVDGDTFEAQLSDVSNPSVVEHAEFSKTQVSSEQLALLRPGALFYWFIGYKDIGRTREHVSQIWMRRGGRMGREKFEEELGKIKHIWGELFGHSTENTSGG